MNEEDCGHDHCFQIVNHQGVTVVHEPIWSPDTGDDEYDNYGCPCCCALCCICGEGEDE